MVNTLLLSSLMQAINQIEFLHLPCVLIARKAIPILVYVSWIQQVTFSQS